MAVERTFTEGEAYALVADNVARETAAANERVTTLQAENTGLQNRIDVMETEKAAEVERADLAEKAFTDFKTNLEVEKAREEKLADRTVKVAEVAPLLEMTEERSARIVAMDDQIFESYLNDLREVAAKKKDEKKDDTKDGVDPEEPDADDMPKKKGAVPRQSAAFGGTSTTSTKASVKGLIGAGRALVSAKNA